MIAFSQLELRKNRALFLALALAFAGTIPFVGLVSSLNDYPVAKGVDAALIFWTLAGLPLAAALFGASGGAGLSGEPSRSSENLLPLSPARRSWSALSSAGVQLALLAALIVLAAFVLSPAWRDLMLDDILALGPLVPYYSKLPIVAGLAVALAALAYTLALCFACALWLRQGVGGGLLGLALAVSASSCVVFGLALEAIFGHRAPFTGRAAAAFILGFAALGWAVGRIADKVERLPRWTWRRYAAGVGALLCGALCGAVFLWSSLARLRSSFEFFASDQRINALTPDYGKWHMPAVRDAAGRGALLASLDGAVIWVSPSGERRELLAGYDRNLSDFLSWPHWTRIPGAAWEEDGSLWVLREADPRLGRYDLYHGTLERGFERHASFNGNFWSGGFLRRGPELGLETYDSNYAPLPTKGGTPRWSTTGYDRNGYLLKGWAEAGKAGRLSDGGKTLTLAAGGKTRRWELPGPVAYGFDHSGFVPALRIAGEDAFLLPVSPPSGAGFIALCRLDGRVERVWPGVRNLPDFEAGPDGAFWGLLRDWKAFLIASDGRFLEPVSLSAAAPKIAGKGGRHSYPRILRFDGAKLWLAVGESVGIVDARSGELLERLALPKSVYRGIDRGELITAAADGFFYHAGRRLHFIRWDGSRKDLGPI